MGERKWNKEIETKRLFLRPFREEDWKSCYENYGQDKALGEFMVQYPVKDYHSMKSMVHDFVQTEEQDGLLWVIQQKETGKCIGMVSIEVPYQELGIGEIGYLLGSTFWKQGYAREAVRTLLNHMFSLENPYSLHLIEAKCNERNTAAQKLLAKLGFVEDGRLRERRIDRVTGKRDTLIVYSIKKEELIVD